MDELLNVIEVGLLSLTDELVVSLEESEVLNESEVPLEIDEESPFFPHPDKNKATEAKVIMYNLVFFILNTSLHYRYAVTSKTVTG